MNVKQFNFQKHYKILHLIFQLSQKIKYNIIYSPYI